MGKQKKTEDSGKKKNNYDKQKLKGENTQMNKFRKSC